MKKAILFCILISATACQVGDSGDGSLNPSQRPSTLNGLRSFADCPELQEHLQDLSDQGSDPIFQPMPSDTVGVDDAAAAEDNSGASAPVTVEEGDLVRSSGNLLFIANPQAGLLIYDTAKSSDPVLLAKIQLSEPPQEIQIDGTRLAVISSQWVSNKAQTTVTLFDVSDASRPQQLSQHSYRGSYTSSRRVGQVLYLALRNSISVYDWPTTEDTVSPCDEVYVPISLEENYTTPSVAWELIGLNMQQPNDETTRVSVMGSWHSHILASPEHFYLATYLNWPDETEVYLFKISPQRASIRPSSRASVPGSIVNQWSIDEQQDVFRIASSTNGFDTGLLRNYVTTFDVSAGQLDPLGQVDSITPGEWITAVRFTKDYAFLTTFVVIDPLVTVDLRRPSRPLVLGELEVPGISRHLEIWDDRILSIGQSDPWCSEVMLTLFDISDLSHPQLIDQLTVSGAYASESLWDHRAASFYPNFDLISLPLEGQSAVSGMGYFAVDRDQGFTNLGNLSHRDIFVEDPDRAIPMRRTLQVGNHLYTLSDAGLSVASFFDPLDPITEQIYPDLSGTDFPLSYSGASFCPMEELAFEDTL